MHCVSTKSRLLKSGAPKRPCDQQCVPARERSTHHTGSAESLGAGGANRDRTDDLLLAKQALSQLSYGPKNWWVWVELNHRPHPYQGCALTN